MKIEIAKELGIWEDVQRFGWGALSNATCGKVGGILNSRLKKQDFAQGK
jgi:hypothetical protein